MKVIMLSHPLKGLKSLNLAMVRSITAYILGNFDDVLPLVPHFFAMDVLDDDNPRHREIGMRSAIAMVRRSDEVWFAGDWRESTGCMAEYEEAKRLWIPCHQLKIRWSDRSHTLSQVA